MRAAEAAALAAVGTRFRLHGRRAGEGLDCVGLAALALRAEGYAGEVPDGYALRGSPERVAERLGAAGLVRVETAEPGHVLLFAAGPGQAHLAIKVTGGIVHADAMLRRVVERPGEAPWPLHSAWRGEGSWQHSS